MPRVETEQLGAEKRTRWVIRQMDQPAQVLLVFYQTFPCDLAGPEFVLLSDFDAVADDEFATLLQARKGREGGKHLFNEPRRWIDAARTRREYDGDATRYVCVILVDIHRSRCERM